MMVQAEAILVDDENEPVVQALESGSYVVLGQPGGGQSELIQTVIRLLRQVMYVPLEHAADIVGTAPVAVRSMIRRGLLDAVTRDGQTYVSLKSALDYRDRTPARRREGLDEMIRISEEGGLYD